MGSIDPMDSDGADGPGGAAESYWRSHELLLLSQVARAIGKTLAYEGALREMLHLMSELLGLNRGRIVLIDGLDLTGGTSRRRRGDDFDSASIQVAYGLTREEITRGRYRPGEGVTGRVLATAQPAVVQDVDAEPAFLFRAVTRDRLPQETVAFIAMPIEVDSRTIGVLACHRIRSRHRQLADDVAILKILATLAGQLLQLRQLVEVKTRSLAQRNALLTRALESAAARYGIIGTSEPLLNAIGELERVSSSTATVLLLGESGTGKELFARALHLASPRRDAPFVKINCAAIPDTLFESELFGHERGAFTGAHAARAGWFEQADRGTVFLDEIGELPLAMQSKLLRTLQEGTIVRLGGKREIPVDLRLVTATNRDLEHEVRAGRFRRDLYYRLNVIPIRLPELAERREDVPMLALHFLSRANQAHQRNVHLSPDALERLSAHEWPGNVRELSNVIERLVLLAEHPAVSVADIERFLPDTGAMRVPTTPAQVAVPIRDYRRGDSHTAEALADALARHGGNQSRAAQSLGLTPRQFAYRWRKLR